MARARETFTIPLIYFQVFTHPNYVCIVLRWGMHEVDNSNQISAAIIDVIRLLKDLIPAEASPCHQRKWQHLQVSGDVLQKLFLRMLCLDAYLCCNCWLP